MYTVNPCTQLVRWTNLNLSRLNTLQKFCPSSKQLHISKFKILISLQHCTCGFRSYDDDNHADDDGQRNQPLTSFFSAISTDLPLLLNCISTNTHFYNVTTYSSFLCILLLYSATPYFIQRRVFKVIGCVKTSFPLLHKILALKRIKFFLHRYSLLNNCYANTHTEVSHTKVDKSLKIRPYYTIQ